MMLPEAGDSIQGIHVARVMGHYIRFKHDGTRFARSVYTETVRRVHWFGADFVEPL
jgi:hypothetical protein